MISPRRFQTGLALALAVGALSASAAPAANKAISPTVKGDRSWTFEPRGVQPAAIKRARLTFRLGQRTVTRRIGATLVRKAVRRLVPLRIPRAAGARDARLRLGIRPPLPALSCRFGNFGTANLPNACWRPYSARSPFNMPASRAAVHPQTAQIVQRVVGFGSGPAVQEGGNAETEKDWGHPLYFAEPDDPVFEVRCIERWRCEVDGLRVRIPNAARPAGGADAHMGVIAQGRRWEYDFYGVRSKPRGGGKLTVVSGGRTRIRGRGAMGLGSDATAAQFGLAAGMIRPAELAAGRIRHALFMTVRCTNGVNVWPADPNRGAGRMCSELGLSNANAPALGQRFYLEMSKAEIDSLLLPRWQRTILHAMAEYGMYVGDTGGAPWAVLFESGTSYTSLGYLDPWSAFGRRVGIRRWWDDETDRYVRYFDMRSAVDWRNELKVLVD